MKWARHVARIRDVHARFWWGILRKRDNLKDTGLDGRIIISWVFGK
jgi:hypothetical protein